MDYLADAVVIIRHFSRSGKIGKKTKGMLKDADQGMHTIWISVISFAEIMYLAERHRINLDLQAFYKIVLPLHNYKILDLHMEIILQANDIKELELHDRLIAASSLFLDIPILTTDKDMKSHPQLSVVSE